MSVSDTARKTMTLRRTQSVHAAAGVRHVDELSESELASFIELVSTGAAGTVENSDFTDGEVIVFTDYYVVDRS